MLDPHLVEEALDLAAGPVLFEAELRVLVEIAADFDHPGEDIPRRRENAGGRFWIHGAKITRSEIGDFEF